MMQPRCSLAGWPGVAVTGCHPVRAQQGSHLLIVLSISCVWLHHAVHAPVRVLHALQVLQLMCNHLQTDKMSHKIICTGEL